MSRRFQGRGVSPGLAIGTVLRVHVESLPVVAEPVPPERVDDEIEKLRAALAQARDDLESLKGRVLAALGDHYAGILEAQRLILEDPMLVSETERRIRIGRVSARWALKVVVSEYERRFAAMDDPYLSERGGDLSDVHQRLQRLLRSERKSSRGMPEGPLIAVARTLLPSDAVNLARKGVIGLATDTGGPTSHTAILAQALNVPAVAGLGDLSRCVRSGEPIILDGDRGEVTVLPSTDETERAEAERQSRISDERQAIEEIRDCPPVTLNGTEIALRANLEFASEVEVALRYGAKGVGLFRSEFLFLTHSPDLPSEEDHFRAYVEVAEKVAPHPAIIRTFDLGGEKYFHDVLDRRAGNPVMGQRAVRLCLRRPDIFRPQLRGLLRAAARSDVRLMLPLVTVVDEIHEVRRLLAKLSNELAAEGRSVNADIPLGIMIEVPAAALSADQLAREVEFFSIGTNDLIQYALAVDRGDDTVGYLYRPLHPAVLRLIRFTVESAERAGIPVSVCGAMAADPNLTELLFGLGLRELSLQPRAIPAISRAVREIDDTKARELARMALAGRWLGSDSAEPKAAVPFETSRDEQ